MTPTEVRTARATLGMTQRELAAALECSRRTVINWEDGTAAVPGPARVALRLMLRSPVRRPARAPSAPSR